MVTIVFGSQMHVLDDEPPRHWYTLHLETSHARDSRCPPVLLFWVSQGIWTPPSQRNRWVDPNRWFRCLKYSSNMLKVCLPLNDAIWKCNVVLQLSSVYWFKGDAKCCSFWKDDGIGRQQKRRVWDETSSCGEGVYYLLFIFHYL